MYQLLISLDHALFLFINHLPHTSVSDAIAMTLSGVYGSMIIAWMLLGAWLFFREKKRDYWFFLPVAVASGLSLLITEIVLKKYFARNRPPVELGTIFVGNPMPDHSFPSGHATFAWALAVVLARIEPRAKWLFYALAFFISLSRVYMGKHYPYDVIAGSLVGIAAGFVALWVERTFTARYHRKRKTSR